MRPPLEMCDDKAKVAMLGSDLRDLAGLSHTKAGLTNNEHSLEGKECNFLHWLLLVFENPVRPMAQVVGRLAYPTKGKYCICSMLRFPMGLFASYAISPRRSLVLL